MRMYQERHEIEFGEYHQERDAQPQHAERHDLRIRGSRSGSGSREGEVPVGGGESRVGNEDLDQERYEDQVRDPHHIGVVAEVR